MAGNTPSHLGFVERFKGKVLESKSSIFQFGNGGAIGTAGGGNLYSRYDAIATTSDTSEDTLDSFSLPANSLDVPGRTLQIIAWGTFSANTHTHAASLYFGAEKVAITGYATSLTGGTPWMLDLTVAKSGSNAQTVLGQSITGTTHGGCTVQTGAESDTAAITVKVTGQTGTAAGFASDVVLTGWYVNAMN